MKKRLKIKLNIFLCFTDGRKVEKELNGHLKQRQILTRIAKLKPPSLGKFSVMISFVSGPAIIQKVQKIFQIMSSVIFFWD